MKAFLRVLRRRISILTVIFVIFVVTFAGQAECEVEAISSDSYYLATVYDKNGEKICSFVPRNYNISMKGEWAVLYDKDNCDRVFSPRFISRIEIKKVIKGEEKSEILEEKIKEDNEEDEFAPIDEY